MTGNTSGSERKKAGRKPVEDPKVQISVYPRRSRIELVGTTDANAIAVKAIEKEYKKRIKQA